MHKSPSNNDNNCKTNTKAEYREENRRPLVTFSHVHKQIRSASRTA